MKDKYEEFIALFRSFVGNVKSIGFLPAGLRDGCRTDEDMEDEKSRTVIYNDICEHYRIYIELSRKIYEFFQSDTMAEIKSELYRLTEESRNAKASVSLRRNDFAKIILPEFEEKVCRINDINNSLAILCDHGIMPREMAISYSQCISFIGYTYCSAIKDVNEYLNSLAKSLDMDEKYIVENPLQALSEEGNKWEEPDYEALAMKEYDIKIPDELYQVLSNFKSIVPTISKEKFERALKHACIKDVFVVRAYQRTVIQYLRGNGYNNEEWRKAAVTSAGDNLNYATQGTKNKDFLREMDRIFKGK